MSQRCNCCLSEAFPFDGGGKLGKFGHTIEFEGHQCQKSLDYTQRGETAALPPPTPWKLPRNPDTP